MKEAAPNVTTGSQINRSQSLLTTTARVPVLAPSRGERARLEALLSDVWTRDILPFPGITARSRSEHLVRASASSVMRKLSVVAIASSFSKRSASLVSLQQKAGTEDDTSQASSNRGKDSISAAGLSSETMEDASRSLLSVILDETEKNSPSLCAMETEGGPDGVVRAVRRLESAEERSEGGSDRLRPYTPVLLLASTSNSRPGSAHGSMFTKGSIREEEKENVRTSQEPYKGSPRTRKLSARWTSRVSVLHRETVVKSIRSIFR
jgi:hypothetical protein